MLESTFIHIPGVSAESERKLWKEGFDSWQSFLSRGKSCSFSEPKKEKIGSFVRESQERLSCEDHGFFYSHLPLREHWRAYKDFSKVCFLDIETTGLRRYRDEVTVIGVYDGKESKIFVNGKNMHLFSEEMGKYSTIVSFNGRCFDVPFLKEKFAEVNFDKLHIDLRFVMRALGFSGGLKKIEKELGIVREGEIEEVDGFEAVRLWHRYLRGDERALKTLIAYNKADIENLKVLMDFAYSKMRAKSIGLVGTERKIYS